MNFINYLSVILLVTNQVACTSKEVEDSSFVNSNSIVVGSVQHAPYVNSSNNYDESVIIKNLNTNVTKSAVIQTNGFFKFYDLKEGEYKIQIKRFQSSANSHIVLEKYFVLEENSILLIPITFRPGGGLDYKTYLAKNEDILSTGSIVGRIDFNSKSITNNNEVTFLESQFGKSKSWVYLENVTDANSERYEQSVDISNSFVFQNVEIGIYVLNFNKSYYNDGKLIETVTSGNVFQLVVLPNLNSVISINSLVTSKQNSARPKFDAPFQYRIWSPVFESEY
ncbi:MAG: carboxypeptidase-like regulatory domain-containing protein [Cytophagales bacterium]|nr:carboxypeptidase-like regulatory domain-containing protein [Cytophagales bacterium]